MERCFGHKSMDYDYVDVLLPGVLTSHRVFR